jgi:DNA-binding transcriptional regulator YiaG
MTLKPNKFMYTSVLNHDLRCSVIGMTERDLLLLHRVREDAKSGQARQTRTAAGFSQSEIAEVTGVSQATISAWESGRRRPRGDAGLRYARLLRCLAAVD